MIAPALAREAVDTSALEGTYGALPDVLEARLPKLQPKSPEVAEIRAYETMAQQGFEWVRERPITIGMLADLQAILANESRVPPRDPGRVREHQVLIGPEGCGRYGGQRQLARLRGIVRRRGGRFHVDRDVAVTTRYFIPVDIPDRLVRVDLDEAKRLAQRLDPEGWVDVLSLFGILLTDDNLRWEEVTRERAEQIGTKISPRTVV